MVTRLPNVMASLLEEQHDPLGGDIFGDMTWPIKITNRS